MPFSTALPTVALLCVASLSLQAVPPHRWRVALSEQVPRVNGGSQRSTANAVMDLSCLWVMGLLIPFAAPGLFGWPTGRTGCRHYWLLGAIGCFRLLSQEAGCEALRSRQPGRGIGAD